MNACTRMQTKGLRGIIFNSAARMAPRQSTSSATGAMKLVSMKPIIPPVMLLNSSSDRLLGMSVRLIRKSSGRNQPANSTMLIRMTIQMSLCLMRPKLRLAQRFQRKQAIMSMEPSIMPVVMKGVSQISLEVIVPPCCLSVTISQIPMMEAGKTKSTSKTTRYLMMLIISLFIKG